MKLPAFLNGCDAVHYQLDLLWRRGGSSFFSSDVQGSVLAGLSWPRKESDLLQKREISAHGPMFHDLAFGDTEDMNMLHGSKLARGSQTGKGTLMRPTSRATKPDLVCLSHHILKLHMMAY
jgi:hypothetical protein